MSATLSSLQTTQPRAVAVLRAAVSNGRLHHAYLLAGPAEAGAKSLAQAVAAALVCKAPVAGDGCLECSACRKLFSGNHPDVVSISPDEKGAISIDTVRELSRRLSLRSTEAARKVVLFAQADAMAAPAQNALLKTLEEPPGPTCFLLTTARPRTLLPTIRSRCQTLRLAPPEKLGAWQALAQAGITAELARPLAALVGSDSSRAQELVDQGVAEILSGLRQALSPDVGVSELLGVAADLGATRERANLALALLEVEVRDRLACAHGVNASRLYLDPVSSELPTSRLAQAASRLAQLRRVQALHVNRTLAIETVLLTLTGRLHDGSTRRPEARRRS